MKSELERALTKHVQCTEEVIKQAFSVLYHLLPLHLAFGKSRHGLDVTSLLPPLFASLEGKLLVTHLNVIQ